MTLICTTATSVSIFSRFGFYGVVEHCWYCFLAQWITRRKSMGSVSSSSAIGCPSPLLQVAQQTTMQSWLVRGCIVGRHRLGSDVLQLAAELYRLSWNTGKRQARRNRSSTAWMISLFAKTAAATLRTRYAHAWKRIILKLHGKSCEADCRL